MNLIDIKYVDFLSLYLERFKKKSGQEWNFRCPLCGDSNESKTKARGWIFSKNNSQELFYFCFNCQASLLFPTFLKTVNAALYDQYIMEKYSSKSSVSYATVPEQEEVDVVDPSVLNKLRKISQFPIDHPAVQYVVKRRIPVRWHSKLYYTDQFKKFVNGIIPEKFEDEEKNDPRIVIPFFDKDTGDLIGFQGRSIDPNNKVRYITISLDENKSCMFGLYECIFNMPHLVLEGPIDAMFCMNAIATAGSISKKTTNIFNDNSIFVFDNEPRAKHTLKKIQGTIDNGYKIALFPKYIREKDINDYALSNPEGLYQLIDHLYYTAASGAEAQMKFNDWKKI